MGVNGVMVAPLFLTMYSVVVLEVMLLSSVLLLFSLLPLSLTLDGQDTLLGCWPRHHHFQMTFF